MLQFQSSIITLLDVRAPEAQIKDHAHHSMDGDDDIYICVCVCVCVCVCACIETPMAWREPTRLVNAFGHRGTNKKHTVRSRWRTIEGAP